MEMRVDSYKLDGGRLCGWVATPQKRRSFQGTTMASGRDIPHDLGQFVVELALDLHEGFWGLLANGATFKSVPGRRLTKPGRQRVREHCEALNAVEGIVNEHVTAWRRRVATPVGQALDAMYARWRALPIGVPLSLEWPVRHLPSSTATIGRSRSRAQLSHSIAVRSRKRNDGSERSGRPSSS